MQVSHKGFSILFKLEIHGPSIPLGKHLLCAWFVHINAVSYSFLPYSINTTHHGQPAPLSHMHVISQPSLPFPDLGCTCLHPKSAKGGRAYWYNYLEKPLCDPHFLNMMMNPNNNTRFFSCLLTKVHGLDARMEQRGPSEGDTVWIHQAPSKNVKEMT